MIEPQTGNLLDADAEALVNTVNTTGVMGKGIALQFKRAFPENFEAYQREAKAGRIRVGEVFVHREHRLQGPRYIINFPTKKHWRQPSRLEYIEEGLTSLVATLQRLKIRSVAVPPLGCGNGGLRWSEVRPLIERALERLPDIRVLLYAPAGAPEAAAMKTRTTRPAMTAGRAALLGLMERYRQSDFHHLTLLEIQKLAYFLQLAGEPLNLRFVALHYGPYADALRHVLGRIEGHFTSGYGAGDNKPRTAIELLPGAAQEAEAVLERDPAVFRRYERVARLIEGFETPFGMELLASVHWIASQDARAAADPATAAELVRAWNPRKSKLMKTSALVAAWNRLHNEGWLNPSGSVSTSEGEHSSPA
jgi:O-acetyl-ADP-ribose deacetylase (regulator of RNase III)